MTRDRGTKGREGGGRRWPGLLPWLCLCLALAAAPVRAAEVDRDLEPAPDWIFFQDPDEQTAVQIDRLVENTFGDLNQVVSTRDVLVQRFREWSAQRLVQDIESASNEPRTWNAELTAYALRDSIGNARSLWRIVLPLVRLTETSAEPYRRAFGALALGSFHGPAFVPASPRRKDPLIVKVPEDEARRGLETALRVLGQLTTHAHPHVRVAAALALGKSGAAGNRERLDAADRLREDALVEPRQAVLLAMGLLPAPEDEALFLTALQDEERRIRRAAALGIALQACAEERVRWAASPKRMRRALQSERILPHLEDGAEAVFARGALAYAGWATDEWRALFDIATKASTQTETARAAAQCLLFCREPWFADLALKAAKGGRALDHVVLASFLQHVAESGSAGAIEVGHKYLWSRTKSPRGKKEWDVRYHVAIGLLRALVAGRVDAPASRERIIEALEAGASRGLQKGPFRDALKEVLDRERRPVLEDPSYVVPERRLEALERAFDDPHGLLARDLRDVVVVRLNDMVPLVFNVNNLKPGTPGDRDKTEIPRRFLKACHERYPYFSRLDLLKDRGRRPGPRMVETGEPRWEVRRK